jgi:hypothetical protein
LSGTLTVADDDQDATISGNAEFDQFGRSLLIHDTDGDGANELLIGSPGFDPAAGPQDAGAAFVFGRPKLVGRATAGDADLTLAGSAEGGQFGDTVAVTAGTVVAGAPAEGTPERPGCGFIRIGETSLIGSSAGEFLPASLDTAQLGNADLLMAGSPGHGGGAGALFFLPYLTGTVDLASPPSGSTIFLGTGAEGLGAAVVVGQFDRDEEPEAAVLASKGQTSSDSAGAVYIVDI